MNTVYVLMVGTPKDLEEIFESLEQAILTAQDRFRVDYWKLNNSFPMEGYCRYVDSQGASHNINSCSIYAMPVTKEKIWQTPNR